jgi:FlaA1/EpsC-like NDP-sugar epimerase
MTIYGAFHAPYDVSNHEAEKKGNQTVTRPWQLTQAVRLLRTVLDIAALSTAHYLAFVLRFEGAVPAAELDAFAYSLPAVLLIQYLCMMACNVPESSWQYVSLLEVRRIGLALTTATALLCLLIWSADFIRAFLPTISSAVPPRGVIVLDLLLGLVGLIGLRVSVRAWYERRARNRRRSDGTIKVHTLLIGAGCAGAEAVKQIAENPQLGIEPVGFLDDDTKKHAMVIHGTRVLGTVADVAKIAQAYGVKQALITIGNPSGENLRRIVDLCKKCGIRTKVIPGIHDMLEGNVNLSGIREVAIEDLLRREPVELDLDSIAAFVNGRRILVTGAGGSIGSELCRIVCRFGPASLVLVEHTENNLFHIHRELANGASGVEIIPRLADVCDHARMDQIFASYRPDMVLHAAAYKHVPMIEWNPGEAIKNNVLGTKTIADLAHQYDVDEFVMISTDKAVNPTSIMGASKRIAEIYIQALSERSQTRFVAVRFGNVLGSAGSVIPTFKEQIARGGPVTVTHPDMKRYFMTIPEACQLVLQAATMGRGGEIFILDMGEPVKIVDLARNLIGLSGLTLDDIEIRFTGMRPGEKLYEELTLKDEIAKKTRHPKIFIGRLQRVDWEDINHAVENLQGLTDCTEADIIMPKLKEIMPEFERSEPSSPHQTTWVRSDTEHELAGLNGIGNAPGRDSAEKKNSPVSLSGVKRLLPLPNNK